MCGINSIEGKIEGSFGSNAYVGLGRYGKKIGEAMTYGYSPPPHLVSIGLMQNERNL